MKNLITFGLIFLTFITTAQELTFKSAELQTGRRTGCYGSGACTFTSSNKLANSADTFAAAFDDKKQALIIRVNPKLLTDKDKIAIFGSALENKPNTKYNFVMQEDLELDKNSIKAIGANLDIIRILAGTYTIEPIGEYYYIFIPIH